MSTIFKYNLSSNEVKGVTSDPNTYDNIDTNFQATIVDPATPDGIGTVPTKIKDGAVVRNATGPEIAGFPALAAADQVLKDRTAAKDFFDLDPVTRKYLKAIVQVTLDEINTLRALHSLADRTPAQAKAAIEGKIDAGDYD